MRSTDGVLIGRSARSPGKPFLQDNRLFQLVRGLSALQFQLEGSSSYTTRTYLETPHRNLYRGR